MGASALSVTRRYSRSVVVNSGSFVGQVNADLPFFYIPLFLRVPRVSSFSFVPRVRAPFTPPSNETSTKFLGLILLILFEEMQAA